MNKEDKHEYKGWLNSDSFIKRAIAVVGYSLIGQLLIFICVFVFFMLIGVIL